MYEGYEWNKIGRSLDAMASFLASAPQLPAIGFADGEEGVREYERWDVKDARLMSDFLGLDHKKMPLKGFVAIPLKQPEDYCECPDFGYYEMGNGIFCSRCNRKKPPSYKIAANKQPKEASTLPDKQPDEYPFKTLQEEHDHLMTFNQEPDKPKSEAVEDLQDQVRRQIKEHDLFNWHEELSEEEMIYLENLLLTFCPIFPKGSIGYEKQNKSATPPLPVNEAAKEYALKWIPDDESDDHWDKKKKAGDRLFIEEHFEAGYAFAKGIKPEEIKQTSTL